MFHDKENNDLVFKGMWIAYHPKSFVTFFTIRVESRPLLVV